MIKVFSVDEMVAAEKASDAAGNSYEEMMEKAGKAVADAVIARHSIANRKVTVLVGPGNNGGDGLVAGRYLAEVNADVSFYLYKDRDPDRDRNLALVQEASLPVLVAEHDHRFRALRSRLMVTDILVDALLGTGVTQPIGGELATLMRKVRDVLRERSRRLAEKESQNLVSISQLESNQDSGDRPTSLTGEGDDQLSSLTTRPFVAAVDCPSGLNCDTGALDPLAVEADLTVTFAGPKRGHFIFPGANACGELMVADIDISQSLPEVDKVSLTLVTSTAARGLMPVRPREGHKGTFGWVLIAAGSSRYWGAASLAGRAAYRAGAGLVALAVPSTIRSSLATQLPEATYPLITEATLLSDGAAKAIIADIRIYKALLVGPGLSEATLFMETLLASRDVLPPLVIDADGLNILATMPNWSALTPRNTILTPHLGEMARLMGSNLGEIKTLDRVDMVQAKAAEWGCVVLLKGAYTVIASPAGRSALLPFANPALATAGSGDVLSGIIVSLLGQGLESYEAAVLGGYLHAAAAQISGIDAGLLAGEIADWVPEVRLALRG
jgi:NAD(P)H-hydrate epimerase